MAKKAKSPQTVACEVSDEGKGPVQQYEVRKTQNGHFWSTDYYKKQYIFAVDIETSGPSVLRNGILAIGWCKGNVEGTVFTKKRLHVKMDKDLVFDDVCLEFWNRPEQSAALKEIQTSPISPKEAMMEFASELDKCDTDYHTLLVSDNPSFDFMFLGHYFEKYLSRKPLAYRFGVEHRKLYDSNSFLHGVFGSNYWKYVQHNLVGTRSNHLPDNDAEVIYKSIQAGLSKFPHSPIPPMSVYRKPLSYRKPLWVKKTVTP